MGSAPRGYPRERVLVSSFRSASGRKGIILIADSLGRPNSTPCFCSLSFSPLALLSLSSTCEAPHVGPVSLLPPPRLRALSFPRPFSLLRFVGEHIPSPGASATVAAAAARRFLVLACVSSGSRIVRRDLTLCREKSFRAVSMRD